MLEENQKPDVNLRYGIDSYVMPARVKAARRDFLEHNSTALDVLATEDSAILELIAAQKESQMGVICDGGMRYGNGPVSFMGQIPGLAEVTCPPGPYFTGQVIKARSIALCGKMSGSGTRVVDDFRYVAAQASGSTIAKQVLPSPATTYCEIKLGGSRKKQDNPYASDDALIGAIIDSYAQIIDELYTVGCRYIQFDEYAFSVLADESRWQAQGLDADAARALGGKLVRLNSEPMNAASLDVVFTLCVKREDIHTTYRYEGDYAAVAQQLFASERIHAYALSLSDTDTDAVCLDYLSLLPEGSFLVLEVADAHEHEPVCDAAVERIVNAASRYVPRERLGLALGCAANVIEHGHVHSCCGEVPDAGTDEYEEDERRQWEKLAQLKALSESLL